VTHAYAGYGTYNVSAQAFDQTPGAQTSPYNWVSHTVIDQPAGTASSSSGVARTTATLWGNVTSVGGDPDGASAWFEYGLRGINYQYTTTATTAASPQAISKSVSGLVEGADYQYRIVVHNAHGDYRSSTAFFSTNARPTITPIDPFSPYVLENSPYTFMVKYQDPQNEAPASGYPRLRVDNAQSTIALSPLGQTPYSYSSGVAYQATATLANGPHTYKYEVQDSLPGLFTANGLNTILANRSIDWQDPINAATSSNGLPNSAWGTSTHASDAPYWHTVKTPIFRRINDTPERVGTTDSYSLWFGADGSGTYDNNGAASSGWFTTPSIDLSEGATHAVHFWTYFDTEDDGTYDVKTVSVIDETGHETKLATLQGYPNGFQHWWPVTISLNAWAHHVVKLKFSFNSIDNQYNAMPGWYVDNIIVGHDTDNDGIPDASENQDVIRIIHWSPDTSFNYTRAVPTAMEYGIQNAFSTASTVFALVQIPDYYHTTLQLNGSSWSGTLLSSGYRGSGTSIGAVPGSQGVYALQTNMTQAGFDVRKLYATDNYTLSVTSGSAKIIMFAMMIDGHTSPITADSDGDGLGDGLELGYTGTDPLARDPDNDGVLDREDARPFTPDDAPQIHSVQPYVFGWESGVQFTVHSPHLVGEANVSVEFVDTTGADSMLTVVHDQGEAYHAEFASVPASFTIRAMDEFRNQMNVTVNFDPESYPDKPVTAQAALGVAGVASGFGETAEGSWSLSAGGFFTTLLEIATSGPLVMAAPVLGTLLLPTAGDGTTLQPLPPVYSYPGTIMWGPYPMGGNAFECSNPQAYMLDGPSNTQYARRGVNGMRADYPSEYTNPNKPGAAVQNALNDPDHWFFQESATRGDLFWVDSSNVLHKWTLGFTPGRCDLGVEVTQESRQIWGVDTKDIVKLLMIMGGLSVLAEISWHIDLYHEPPTPPEFPAPCSARWYDANNFHAYAGTSNFQCPTNLIGTLNRAVWHSIGTADVGKTEQQIVAIGWKESIKYAFNGTIGPSWYWNTSRTHSLTNFQTPPVWDMSADHIAKVNSGQASNGRPEFMDLFGIDALPGLDSTRDSDLMTLAGQHICAYRSSDPSYRDAYLAAGIKENKEPSPLESETSLAIDVGQNQYQDYGGPCSS
jgi:hypothetical protein